MLLGRRVQFWYDLCERYAAHGAKCYRRACQYMFGSARHEHLLRNKKTATMFSAWIYKTDTAALLIDFVDLFSWPVLAAG